MDNNVEVISVVLTMYKRIVDYVHENKSIYWNGERQVSGVIIRLSGNPWLRNNVFLSKDFGWKPGCNHHTAHTREILDKVFPEYLEYNTWYHTTDEEFSCHLDTIYPRCDTFRVDSELLR